MPKYDKRIAILGKIIRYCEQIYKTIEQFGKAYEIFSGNFIYQNACGMCVLQIGELASRLSEDFKAEHSQIPWHLIRGMRNIFAHEYENVSLARMWKTIETDIPILKAQCEEILRLVKSETPS